MKLKAHMCALLSVAMALGAGVAKAEQKSQAASDTQESNQKQGATDKKAADKSKAKPDAAKRDVAPLFATTLPTYDEWHGIWPPGLPPGWFEPLAFAGTMPRDPAAFARINSLSTEPGLIVTFPPAIDTILGDAGGWRSALAQYDIGVKLEAATVIAYNPLDTGQPNFPTRYMGQNFTLQTLGIPLTLLFALDKYGLPDAKFVSTLQFSGSSVDLGDPDGVYVRSLYYYQSFFNKALEIKLGYVSNFFEFIGLFVGGSPVLSSGLAGVTPLQVGMSSSPYGKPSAIVTLNGKDGLYVKGAVQESTSPEGRNYELANNRFSLDWGLPGAAPLYIGEVGINRPATPGNHQMWLRAGGIYNTTDYDLYLGPGTAKNGSVYVAGDYQFQQIDKMLPFRGIYGGVSYFWAPDNVNAITQTWEGRLYGIGLMDSRPLDTVTLRLTYNDFSNDIAELYSSYGLETATDQINFTASYSYHAGPGIYFIPSVAWIKNPSLVGDFKDALSMQAMLYLFF